MIIPPPSFTELVVRSAERVSDFLDALHNAGIGDELTQKLAIAATPEIVAAMLKENHS